MFVDETAMRILHIALDVNMEHGGPPRSISGLCKALANTGNDVSLFVHDPRGVDCVDVGTCRLFWGTGCGFKGHWRSDVRKVLNAVKPDVVHLHGVWNLPLHVDEAECRQRGIPYLIAPRGSLDPWGLSQKTLKKRLALWVYQLRDLNRAAAIHVTSDMEAEYVRAVGFTGRIVTSPNGINFPAHLPARNLQADGKRRFLFLSRISPKKGLLELVRAWSRIKHDGWLLEIVGNDSEGYWKVIEDEINSLGCWESILKVPALDDVHKWEAYARADVFVLPTYTENFGIVVAEALYAGVPVITTKGAPWNGLVSNNAGWWIDIGVEPLVSAMKDAMEVGDVALAEMGRRGGEYVRRSFDWRQIANAMIDDYRDIVEETR